MGVPYDLFTAAFIGKVTEYDFLRLDEYDRNATIDGYMKRACAEFNTVCKHDLLSRDDALRELQCDIPEDELDEIVDIVSEGMLVQWFKPYFYNKENLQNVLNTSDFSAYSPAELLYRVTSAYNASKRDFKNMIKEYSYDHGELDKLSI